MRQDHGKKQPIAASNSKNDDPQSSSSNSLSLKAPNPTRGGHVQRDMSTDVCILWRILANLRSGDKMSVRGGGDFLILQPPSLFTPLSRSWHGDKRDAIPDFIHPILARKTIEALKNGKVSSRDELKTIIPDGLRALQSLKDTYSSDLLFCARLGHSLYLLKKDMEEHNLIST